MAGSILLLAYQRPDVLKQSIASLKNARLTRISNLIVVFQEGDQVVDSHLNDIDWIPKRILRTSYKNITSPAAAINSNIHLGISEAFKNQDCEYVAVIEDDICVSVDFFDFISSVYDQNTSDKNFRGINGFSGIPRGMTSFEDYGRYRYGVGWGWVLTRKSWDDLRKFWTGTEDVHWDGLVEVYFRSGYVVAPGMSRIRNIGFGSSATHTRAAYDTEVAKVEQKLNDSFICEEDTESKIKYRFSQQDLNWRSDCISFTSTRGFIGKLIHLLFLLNFFLELRLLRYLPSAKLVPIFRALTIRLGRRLALMTKKESNSP